MSFDIHLGVIFLECHCKDRLRLVLHEAKYGFLGFQWLLPSEGGYLEAEGLEQTRRFSQEAIVNEVDISSSRKAFDLQLPGLRKQNLSKFF
jgi:hypothetical protein